MTGTLGRANRLADRQEESPDEFATERKPATARVLWQAPRSGSRRRSAGASEVRRLLVDANADAVLMNGMQRGDPDAIERLYDRHAASMLGVAIKVLGGREDAEDLVHDVFMEAWQRSSGFRPERGSVRTWLLVRTRSRAIDRMRALGSARRHARETLAHPPEPQPSQAPEPSRPADQQKAIERLRCLPAAQRDLLELAYFGGLSCSEISKRTGVPLGTVKSRLSSGLEQLRLTLGGPDR